MSQLETDLAPLNIIRTETVLSKLPIHNLSSKERVDLQITRHNEHGQTELHWHVYANQHYGFPGQLAYKIDTIIINQIIDELGRPIPKILRLGTINEICLKLGLRKCGNNIRHIKKAILQNATCFINAKLTYKGNDGTERHLEAVFNRYSVVFTGERLPNGKKADAVYLILDEPYLEVLNNAPVRPLDYSYLKELTPAAQRFYEIISYRMFVAIKYKHPQAKLLYSDLCMFSAQSRYCDYDHFKKQMYKIHKPHLTAGYIQKVEYQETTDAESKPDWMMYYTPGPKAKVEYRAFNGKQLVEAELINSKKEDCHKEAGKRPEPKTKAPKQKVTLSQPSAKETPTTPTQTAEPLSPSPMLSLVQHFHKLARNQDNYKPNAAGKETSQAEVILKAYGLDKAKFIVAFAVEEAKKTNFQMRTFGAVLQYVSDAIAEYERRAEEQARRRAQQEQQRRQEAEACREQEAWLKSLPESQYKAIYEQVKAEILSAAPWLKDHRAEALLQSRIREEMIWQLDKQKIVKN